MSKSHGRFFEEHELQIQQGKDHAPDLQPSDGVVGEVKSTMVRQHFGVEFNLRMIARKTTPVCMNRPRQKGFTGFWTPYFLQW